MYCKMCGNLLGDTDLFCRMCGYEIEERKVTSVKKEESISNPSDDGNEIAAKHEADQREQQEGEKVRKPEHSKIEEIEEEFSWNIYEFPKPRKTEDINFYWGESHNNFLDQDEGTKKTEEAVFQTAAAVKSEPDIVTKESQQKAEEAPPKKPEEEFPLNFDVYDVLNDEIAAANIVDDRKTIELTKKTIRYKKSKFMEHVLSDGKSFNDADILESSKAIEPLEATTMPEEDHSSGRGEEFVSAAEIPIPDLVGNPVDKELESQLFADLTGFNPDDLKKEETDENKCFVFNKKNEEFQKLLDREYERIKEHENQNYPPISTTSLNEVMGTESPMPEETPLAPDVDPTLFWSDKYAELEDGRTSICGQPMSEDAADLQDEPGAPSSIDRSYLDEMAAARESFFGGTAAEEGSGQLSAEVVNAKKKYDTVEITVNSSKPVKVEVALSKDKAEQIEKITADDTEIPITEVVEISESEPPLEFVAAWNRSVTAAPEEDVVDLTPEKRTERAAEEMTEESSETILVKDNDSSELKEEVTIGDQHQNGQLDHDAEQTDNKKEEPNYSPYILPYDGMEEEIERKRKKKSITIAVTVVAVIVIVVVAVIGVAYFAPNSGAGSFLREKGAAITGMFASRENTLNEDGAEPVNANADMQTTEPSIYPADDKTGLIENNQGRNVNIESIKANNDLRYEEGRDYGVADINNSKPIMNNIWSIGAGDQPVYYDNEIVGTLMAYDSQWIDYVNGGSNAVLQLTKPESSAYNNALNFSKVGKVKETFKLLEIGEIRKGDNGYYAWCHEEIQVDEGGRLSTNENNWIYFLEPVSDKFQIVNFYKF